MLKAVETLLNSEVSKKLGNHQVEIKSDIKYFIYHSTVICKVNTKNKTFIINNGGYNTSSTNRAINDYRRHFSSIGYEEVPYVK